MLVQLAVLLSIAVIRGNAQASGPSGSLGVPGPPPSCHVETREAVDTDDIARQLNNGELGPSASQGVRGLAIKPPPVLRCEDGPKSIIHTVPNEFYFPPIRRGSCDNLFCKDPPCIVRKKVWRSKCVYVFKLIKGKWVFIGRRTIRYIDHLECGCKECSDITHRARCEITRPCPNSLVINSFCYWTTKCECCKPVRCQPGSGQIFDRKTCQCVCPKGSKKNRAGNCVGDCEDINLHFCPSILCADNQHLKCKVENYKCVCPSCDDVTSTRDCTRTNCLEQRSKPPCKVDPCTKKCRCPRCEEQSDRVWCARTYCGPNSHLQCRWNPYYRSCSCPH